MDWSWLKLIDWLTLIDKIGYPAFFTLLAGFVIARLVWPFVTNKVWPFIVKQVEDSKKERVEERDKFLLALNTLTLTLQEHDLRLAAQLSVLTSDRDKDRGLFFQAQTSYIQALDKRDDNFSAMINSVDGLKTSVVALDTDIGNRLSAVNELLLQSMPRMAKVKTKARAVK